MDPLVVLIFVSVLTLLAVLAIVLNARRGKIQARRRAERTGSDQPQHAREPGDRLPRRGRDYKPGGTNHAEYQEW